VFPFCQQFNFVNPPVIVVGSISIVPFIFHAIELTIDFVVVTVITAPTFHKLVPLVLSLARSQRRISIFFLNIELMDHRFSYQVDHMEEAAHVACLSPKHCHSPHEIINHCIVIGCVIARHAEDLGDNQYDSM